MKNYFIILIFTLTVNLSYSQGHILEKDELKSGKHFNRKFSLENGDWVCTQCSNGFKIRILQDVYHFTDTNVNVFFDRINVTVTEFIYNGKDISKQFTEAIQLLANLNDKPSVGYYRDPITNNQVKVEIRDAGPHKFTLYIHQDMSDPRRNNNGTILPSETEFVR